MITTQISHINILFNWKALKVDIFKFFTKGVNMIIDYENVRQKTPNLITKR